MEPSKYVCDHDALREKLDRIEALSFLLLAANDRAELDFSSYNATAAGVIHDLAVEARELRNKIEGNARKEAA